MARYNRRQTRRRRGYGGRRNLAKTLRARQRKKVGLNTRVTLANRNQIRKIKKSITTKVKDNTQATAANNFNGQFEDLIEINNLGQTNAGGTLVNWSPSLLTLATNTPVDRDDQWVQMKSLTMKYCWSANDPRQVYQKIHLFLVLDNEGASAETGNDGPVALSDLLTRTGVAPYPANAYANAFQNLATTGLKGRFKILWKKTHICSTATMKDTTQVPAIVTAAPSDTTRAAYTNAEQVCKRYPPRVYGSVTIKRPYKLNYGTQGLNSGPVNQTIRLFAFTESIFGANGANGDLQYYCRFRYKDL